MLKFTICLLIALTTQNVFAEDIQKCTRVDEADDWTLTFDFSEKKVAFFDNNATSTGLYRYSIETVEGVYVFESEDKNDSWIAEFYGSKKTNGNKAVLVLGDTPIEFICLRQ